MRGVELRAVDVSVTYMMVVDVSIVSLRGFHASLKM